MPQPAIGENSRKGAPASSRALMRSRGSSLPRATCFLPVLRRAAEADGAVFSRRSSTSARMAAALALEFLARVLSWI
jgi:hypothetical protein